MQKFLETKKFFQKFLENFQPPPPRTKKFQAAAADREKKIEISQPPPPSAKSFLAAAAEGRKKLKISSPRCQERHRLTPLFLTDMGHYFNQLY
jgi:hypothetical protein